MGACVIVMGYDYSTLLPPSVLAAATAGGGIVVAGCNPCAFTRRITVQASTKTPSGFETCVHDCEELKPAETYVVTFDDSGAANAWLDGQAHLLRRKRIYRIDPAVTYP